MEIPSSILRFFPFQGGKFSQKIFLALVQSGRDLDQDLDVLVAPAETVEVRNSLTS